MKKTTRRGSTEKTLTTKYVIPYIKNMEYKLTGIFEVKKARKGKLYFSQFEDHQLDNLINIWEKGLVWKISDADSRLKPADIINFPAERSMGYVVAIFHDEKKFMIIDAMSFSEYVNSCNVSFIDYENAKEISLKIINY